MSKAKLTMIGLESFMNKNDDSLFSSMTIPEGIEKDDLTDNILLRAGEFEVLYSDPYFLKDAISLWSRKNNRTFTKWYTALNIDYNPLENYDRMETWTDGHSETSSDSTSKVTNGTVTDEGSVENSGTITDAGSKSNTGTVSDSGSQTNTGTQQNSTVTPETTTTVLNSRSAYDSSVFTNDTKSETTTNAVTVSATRTDNLSESTSNTRTDNLSESTSNTRTDNLSESTSNTQSSDITEGFTGTHTTSYENTRNGRTHGNIGVTTSQQMLQAELDIAKWNLYEQIADLFISEFCIMVY